MRYEFIRSFLRSTADGKTKKAVICLVILFFSVISMGVNPAKAGTWTGSWGGGGSWDLTDLITWGFVDTDAHKWSPAERLVARAAIDEWKYDIPGLFMPIIEVEYEVPQITIQWQNSTTFFKNWADPNGDGKFTDLSDAAGVFIPRVVNPTFNWDYGPDIATEGYHDNEIYLRWDNTIPWYVDDDPYDDSEFGSPDALGRQKAIPGGDADGKHDLYTVIKHEFGHALGLLHTTGPGLDGIPWTNDDVDNGDVMWGGFLGDRRHVPKQIAPEVGQSERRHLTDEDVSNLQSLYALLPVGGTSVLIDKVPPVDKFGLLALCIGLASTITVGAVVTVVFIKRYKKKNGKV